MSIKLNAQSGGSVALDAPTQTTGSADNVYKLPVADGSAGQVLKTDGSGNLSWVTLSDPDYVKLQQAAGTLGASELNFDNLDVSTYKFFDLMAFLQPATDAQGLRFYFRTGGASGSNVTSNAYAYGFNLKKESNTSVATAGSPDTYMRLSSSVGNHASEGIFITMRISLAKSSDNSSAKYIANNVTWNANLREQGNDARMINGQGHFFDGTTYSTGFGFHFGSGNINNYSYTLYGIKG